jgi:serine/threonine protein kinase/ankyrin repeat protein
MSAAKTDDNQGTVRIDDEKNTVRLKDDDSTVRLDAVNSTAAFSGAGSAAEIMTQQKAKFDIADAVKTGEVFTPGQVIEINNKACAIESIVSMSSGEAVIYKVKIDGWPFVLKHYKINTPLGDNAKEVLKKIKYDPKERIVKLSDFGRRYDQDYEIMEFAEGGTLDQYLKDNGPIKDIDKLKGFVKQINEGLGQLHNELRIIYQDLKPENIYFRDENKTEIVLADFGISSVMEPGKNTAVATANATTIYAAPDLARIGNEKYAVVGPAVDYFALGITMLHLWNGATPFQNMPESERVRQIRDKDVVFPDDMPSDCKALIQGLIDPLSKSRWGDKQVKKWLAGESMEIEYRKTSITYEPRMFNETENYTNPVELAALMDKYPDRGKQCLYSDILTSWLEKANDHFLLDDIKNIVSTYANDRDAGLYSAIYKLDPMRPFITKSGKICTNTVEIADAIMEESAYYKKELKKASARLYLYFETVEGLRGKEIAEQLCKNFKEYSPKRALALVYFKLQPDGGQSITIGSKTYQSPEEVAAETDVGQIGLIKQAVIEEDSLFLVWLSDHYGEYFTTTGGFRNLKTQDRFFLFSLFPFLSFKEFVNETVVSWEQAAIYELIALIINCPGRSDLFKAYVDQGLPFSGQAQAQAIDWQPTALDYLASFIKEITDIDTGLGLVRFLHEHGADINEESGNGSFPLFNAVFTRNVPLVECLLKLGADPNKEYQGNSMLLFALSEMEENEEEENRIAIANLLLDYKANVNVSNSDIGRTALHIVQYFESPDKVNLASRLLKAGADVNKQDKNKNTPLMFAIYNAGVLKNTQSALAVLEMLLKNGAKTEALYNDGTFSPLMTAAAENNSIEAAKLLLKYGAKKDFADKYGNTAFVYAAQNNNTEMMALVDPGEEFKTKHRLLSFLKAAVSVLAIAAVFLTMDAPARIVTTLHLSYPVLIGVSILLSHLFAAYILIVLLGLREYLTRLRGTFNFIGRSVQYILGVPIVFPLAVSLLQFPMRFLPQNVLAALSFLSDMIMRQNGTMLWYIALLAVMMSVSLFISKINDSFARKWQNYKRYL